MSAPELQAVVNELESQGFKPAVKGGFKKRAGRADLRLVHVLWKLLREAGELKDPTRAGLNAFIRSRFGNDWGYEVLDVDDLTDAKHIAALVNALRDWNLRVGTPYNEGQHR